MFTLTFDGLFGEELGLLWRLPVMCRSELSETPAVLDRMDRMRCSWHHWCSKRSQTVLKQSRPSFVTFLTAELSSLW